MMPAVRQEAPAEHDQGAGAPTTSSSRCAKHEEAEAIATCTRCGRFACPACLSDEPGWCVTCDTTAGDPFGIKARAFTVADSVREGVKLAAREAGPILAVCLAFAVPAGLLQLLIPGDDLRSMRQSVRLSNAFDSLVGIVGTQALVARLMATAEGRRLPLSAAFSISLKTWARCFGARFRVGLAVLAFSLLLVLPGLWKYVQLLFVTTAVLRSRENPLALSRHLVDGRWWRVFGLSVVSALMAFGPASVGIAIFSVFAELTHAPPLISGVFGEWISSVAKVVSASVTLVAFYGLHRESGTPLGPLPFQAQESS